MLHLSKITERDLGGQGALVEEQFRWAFEIAVKSDWHRKKTVADLGQLINAAIRHQHIRFFFNPREEAVGYVIWAMISKEVRYRFEKSVGWDIHISEWTEGEILWIMDLAAPYGH